MIILLPALSLFRNVSTGVYRSSFSFLYHLSQYEDSLWAFLSCSWIGKAQLCSHHFLRLWVQILCIMQVLVLYKIFKYVCNYMLLGHTCRHCYWFLIEVRHDYNWSPRWKHPTALIIEVVVTMAQNSLIITRKIYKSIYESSLLLFTLSSIYNKSCQWKSGESLSKKFMSGHCHKCYVTQCKETWFLPPLWKKLNQTTLQPQVCLGHIISFSKKNILNPEKQMETVTDSICCVKTEKIRAYIFPHIPHLKICRKI